MENQVKEIIGKVLEKDLSNYKLSEINMNNIENWDSFAHLKIVITLEEEFNIEIEPEEIQQMKDGAEQIVKIIESKKDDK